MALISALTEALNAVFGPISLVSSIPILAGSGTVTLLVLVKVFGNKNRTKALKVKIKWNEENEVTAEMEDAGGRDY